MPNKNTRNEQRKNGDKTPPARRKAPHAEQRAKEAVEIKEAKQNVDLERGGYNG